MCRYGGLANLDPSAPPVSMQSFKQNFFNQGVKNTSLSILSTVSAGSKSWYNAAGFKEPFLEYPGHDCCTIYSDKNFGGRKETYCHNGDVTVMRGILNDEMSSYHCGRNVWYDMCDGNLSTPDSLSAPTNECWEKNGIHGAGHAWNPLLSADAEDKMTTLVLGPYDPSILGAAVIYKYKECIGQSARFFWNPRDIQGGVYDLNATENLGSEDDTASSISVPPGYYVEVYLNNLIGDYSIYAGRFDNNDFENQMRYCYNLGTYDNRMSSLIVKKNKANGSNGAAYGVAGAAKGFWYGITSTYGIESPITVGITNGLTYLERDKSKVKITEALELGLEYSYTGQLSPNISWGTATKSQSFQFSAGYNSKNHSAKQLNSMDILTAMNVDIAF